MIRRHVLALIQATTFFTSRRALRDQNKFHGCEKRKKNVPEEGEKPKALLPGAGHRATQHLSNAE